MQMNYTESDVPDLTGKVFFVTGANIGVGFETARILAQKNGRVLLGCRSEDKAAEALNQIRTLKPEADVVWVPLDLSSLRSIAVRRQSFRTLCLDWAFVALADAYTRCPDCYRE